MSNSYLLIELDTTAPTISIDCPKRSIPNNTIEIKIKANEILSEYQEFYIIDISGGRHDLIFSKIDEYTFVGYVDLQTYPIGNAKLYSRLSDEVLNKSDLYVNDIFIGYLSVKDNYDAYLSMQENVITLHKLERNMTITIQQHKSKVGVIDNGTDWGYS